MKPRQITHVIFVLGTGHCGSTMLDLMLGRCDSARSLGELRSFDRSSPNQPWYHAAAEPIHEALSFRRNRVRSWLIHRLPKIPCGRSHLEMYDAIARIGGCDTLIDSSKQIMWIRRGIKHLQSGGVRCSLIHLLRNPVAVSASYFRKYSRERSILEVGHDVAKRFEENDHFFHSVDVHHKHVVVYEALCQAPESVIHSLCKAISLPYDEEMTHFWASQDQIAGGNAGTRSLAESSGSSSLRGDQSYYSNHGQRIREDRRWNDDLSESDQHDLRKLMFASASASAAAMAAREATIS